MKIKKLLVLSLLIAGGIFIRGESAFAATKTWIGTDCAASSTDCGWSESGNWQGGVIPANGDDIVIHGTSSVDSMTRQDIPSLTIGSITTSGLEIENPGHVGEVFIRFDQNTSISGNITHQAPSGAVPSGRTAQKILNLSNNITPTTLTLTGNSKFTNISTSDLNINLNGHELGLVVDIAQDDDAKTHAFRPIITGNGVVSYELPIWMTLHVSDENTYTGTTNLISMDYVSVVGGATLGMFGGSEVNISSQARVLFDTDVDVTLNNKINVSPPSVEGTFLDDQVMFWTGTGNVTFTVPNITLLGNARFSINDLGGPVTVNLAGITANGHCVQYGDDNADAEFFLNGPAACTVAVGAQNGNNVPNVPDTGFGLLLNNPAVTLSVAALAAGAIIVMSRRMKPATKRARR